MSKQSIQLTDGSNTMYPESADSGTGYCKMADGTLIQYGNVALTASVNAYIPFQIPFVSGSYAVSATYIYSGSQLWCNGKDLNAFNLIGNGTANASWIAIGRWK